MKMCKAGLTFSWGSPHTSEMYTWMERNMLHIEMTEAEWDAIKKYEEQIKPPAIQRMDLQEVFSLYPGVCI